MKPAIRLPLPALLLNLAAATCLAASDPADGGLRLYIFDNGTIEGLSPELFNFTAEEVAETGFVVTSYLIVHPRGTLLWEAGAIPDHDFPADGSTAFEGVVQADMTLASQLKQVGYTPADIDYFAMSHLHSDHTGNANDFAGSRWIVQQAEKDAMFSGEERAIMAPATFAALQDADATVLDNADYDVFGDGSVRIVSTPGHTPGHQVLLLDLPQSGPILLAGDLYHYPEEITTGRTPTFEFAPEISAASRAKVAELLERTGAQMWIGHDKTLHAGLNFAPAYYE